MSEAIRTVRDLALRIAGVLATATLVSTAPDARAGSGNLYDPGVGPNNLDLYFNFRFEPTQAEIEDAKEALQEASELLCDATDGQLIINFVRITTGRTSEDAANIWYLSQDGRSFAQTYVDGSAVETRGMHVALFNDDLNAGVIAHELAHHALGVGDEYREECRFDTGCGIGECFESGTTDSRNNCLMQRTAPPFTEFCVAENHDPVRGEAGGDDGTCGMPECASEMCEEDDCSERWNSDTGGFEVSHQELWHGRSCWETITANYPFFRLPDGLPTASVPEACSEEVFFRELLGDTEQVFLVIDRSGSMAAKAGPSSERNRLAFARAAARAFGDFYAGRDAAVGVISFATLADVDLRPVVLEPDELAEFKAAVDALEPDGRTSLGLALAITLQEFAALPPAPARTVVVLSDGQDNPDPDARLSISVPGMAERLRDEFDARIISIPLGIGADRETLSEIARLSGGVMFDAFVGDELPPLYAEIAAFLRGEHLTLPRTPSAVKTGVCCVGQAPAGPLPWLRTLVARARAALLDFWTPWATAQSLPESEEFPFEVEAGAERLNVLLSARNPDVDTWNPDFRLLGPEGEVIEDTDERVRTDTFYRLIVVDQPAAGTWTLEVIARDSTEQLSFVQAHVENALPDCFVDAQPPVVGPGGTVRISASASFVADLDGPVTYEGEVRRPDGSVVPLTFTRDPLGRTISAEFDDFVGRGGYDVTVQCSVAEGAHVRSGEIIFDGPDTAIEAEPFERVARTAFFSNATTLPPCTISDCDGDGIINVDEGSDDIDGDGLPCDRDDDCDGDDLPDELEGLGDSDGDGTVDFLDPDSDNDCIPDGGDANPTLPDSPVCGDGYRCPGEECEQFASDADCPGLCAPAGASDACTCRPSDHYKCYKTRQVGARFPQREVTLTDQFGTTTALVRRAHRLCNPVDKNGEGIADSTAHLMCYKIAEPHFAPRDVIVDDQFGEHALTVRRPASLCLPAEKDGVPSNLSIDHFKCYKVKRSRRAQRFPDQRVELTDQFETKDTIVQQPRFLCNPVDKAGEGIRHPESQLLCYRIEDVPGQPRFQRRGVEVFDQFVDDDLNAIRGDCRASSFLCVPATQQATSPSAFLDIGPEFVE